MSDAHAHEEGHPEIGHVVSVKMLVGVLMALLFLTVLTVAVSYVDLGPFNLAVAMLVAVVKASLVVLFFMHLRWDRPFNAVLFGATILFLGLFIGIVTLDKLEYQKDIIPDFGKLDMPQYADEGK